MRHAICRLSFDTAVRFGSDAGGSSLAGAGMTFRADMLFSALFSVLQPQGQSEALLYAVQAGELAFSDAFPWREAHLFLPRPVGIFSKPDNPASEDPSQRKLLKKISFIPVDSLSSFMDGQSNLLELHRLNHFGSAFEQTRVNLRDGDQPLPYRVGGFRFDKDCGLYLIVSGSEAALTLFERGMASLSAGGIGGKASSGWGKFTMAVEPASPNWVRKLENEQAPLQLLLSTALPSADELSNALEGACYTVVRRGGFAASTQVHPLKKQTVYLLGSGSTFRHRFRGSLLDVGIGMPHPVWRYARAMFMGVRA